MQATEPPHVDASSERAKLSRGEFAFCIGVSLAVFFLWQGPFWRHRWQIDGSVWYSYLVIPLVVAAVLARAHKLTVVELSLGTLEVVCWKFGLTYLVAHTMWMFSSPPPRAEVPPPSLPDAPAVARRTASIEETGSLSGSVRDAAGAPASGAIVFIDTGVDAYTFPVTAGGPSFDVRAGAIEPPLAVAELGQFVRAHSTDGKLHTLVASLGDGDFFNLPLQSSGAFATSELRERHGVASLRCTVHEHSGEVGRLVVVNHPFHSVADDAGHFAWTGVPAGKVVVVALHPSGRTARVEQSVVAREDRMLSLVLGE